MARIKSVASGVALGAIVTFGALYVYEAVGHINHHPAPSHTAVTKPLQPMTVDSSWIKSGNPEFHVVQHASNPDGSSGIWKCDGPTTFEWTFWEDERVYILEGSVDIEYRGKRFTLKPGDTALFFAGTKAVWHVPKTLTKTFTVHQPNRVVQLYRRIRGIV